MRPNSLICWWVFHYHYIYHYIGTLHYYYIPVFWIVAKWDLTVWYAGTVISSLPLHFYYIPLQRINIKWDLTVWYAGATTRKCLRPKNRAKSVFFSANQYHQYVLVSKKKKCFFSSWFWIWEHCEVLPESRPGIHASKPSRQINFQAAE